MCAITGYISVKDNPPPQLRRTFARLLMAGSCRGTDATGFMYPTKDTNQIFVVKCPGGPPNVIESIPDYCPRWMVGHNRQQTGGPPADNRNNHPVVYRNWGLVHNGQVRKVLSSPPGGKLNYPKLAEVDTQLLVETIGLLTRANWKPATAICRGIPRYLNGSYACVAVDSTSPNTLHLFRETSPLVLAYDTKLETIFLASTPGILHQALGEEIQYLDGLFSSNEIPESIIFQAMEDRDYLRITLGSNSLSWEGSSLEFPTYQPYNLSGHSNSIATQPSLLSGVNYKSGTGPVTPSSACTPKGYVEALYPDDFD